MLADSWLTELGKPCTLLMIKSNKQMVQIKNLDNLLVMCHSEEPKSWKMALLGLRYGFRKRAVYLDLKLNPKLNSWNAKTLLSLF